MRYFIGTMRNMFFLSLEWMNLIFLLLGLIGVVGYFITGYLGPWHLAKSCLLMFIPIFLIAHSRNAYSSKWYVFEDAWSVPIWMNAVARHIFFAAASLVMAGLWIISPLHDGNMAGIVILVGLSSAIISIYCPVLLLLRGRKGDLDQFVLITSMLGAIAADVLLTERGDLAPLVGIASAVLFIASAFLCVLIGYKNKV